MEFNIEEHNVRIVIVSLSNRIDAFSAPALRERFSTIFDQGVNHLVADFFSRKANTVNTRPDCLIQAIAYIA